MHASLVSQQVLARAIQIVIYVEQNQSTIIVIDLKGRGNMMAETASETGKEIWKKFLTKHWNMVVLFVVGAILVSIGAILEYLRFVGHAQSTGLVPATLGLWTMGNIVTFILQLILWEVLIIGVAIALAAVALIWWYKLPDEEKEEYARAHLFGSKKTSGGSGAIELLLFIAFCIKVFTDGNWNVAFANWTFDYLVYSCLWACIWVLIIFGIPMVVGGLLWIIYEMKKKP